MLNFLPSLFNIYVVAKRDMISPTAKNAELNSGLPIKFGIDKNTT